MQPILSRSCSSAAVHRHCSYGDIGQSSGRWSSWALKRSGVRRVHRQLCQPLLQPFQLATVLSFPTQEATRTLKRQIRNSETSFRSFRMAATRTWAPSSALSTSPSANQPILTWGCTLAKRFANRWQTLTATVQPCSRQRRGTSNSSASRHSTSRPPAFGVLTASLQLIQVH